MIGREESPSASNMKCGSDTGYLGNILPEYGYDGSSEAPRIRQWKRPKWIVFWDTDSGWRIPAEATLNSRSTAMKKTFLVHWILVELAEVLP